jgi:uncharacterized protein
LSREAPQGSRPAPQKPSPDVFTYTEPFWKGTNEGELRIQVCSSCSNKQWYPKVSCENCGERQFTWVKSSGKGTVYSFTLIREVVMNSPAFEKEIPYALSIVELDEGVRMVAQIFGCPPDQVKIGMAVEAFFEKIDGFSVVKFKPTT